jgi:class 3 adenylate cyclase
VAGYVRTLKLFDNWLAAEGLAEASTRAHELDAGVFTLGVEPLVRGRGLYTVEATRQGRNYTGRGVHIAARVEAAAGSEEILVTSAVLSETRPSRFRLSEPRSLTLKGVREAIEVRAVDWR